VNEDASLPADIRQLLARAEKLEWQTLLWLAIIVVAMTLTMGGSQAFKTAWIEDLLSMLAPTLFLISRRIEKIGPRNGFPFGFQRVSTLTFFFSACALCAIGGILVFNGIHELLGARHPSISSVHFFGREIWLGWVMITVLVFSIIPPVVLGRKKRTVARRLHDKVLYIDAETNAADWQTGLASIGGILGIAYGLWWADSAMATVVALGILKDGFSAIKGSTFVLIDGMSRSIDSHEVSDQAKMLKETLERMYPGSLAQIRETGRHLRARIEPQNARALSRPAAVSLLASDSWRLIELGCAIEHLPAEDQGSVRQ
jgi:divalent metal cation (Fe/Co/Zn/Cd) transporter